MEQIVTLQPNESQVLTFTFVPTEAKIYHVAVDGLSRSLEVFASELPPFSVSQATWDAPMPFKIGSLRNYSFAVKNLDTLTHGFKVELYWLSTLMGTWITTLRPNFVQNCRGNQEMPINIGTYDMIVKLWIDDIYAGEFLVSKVRVAQYYQPGDANGDGEINMGDVTMVERIVVGLEPPTLEADANQDGEINMGDVTKIERIVVGLDDPPDPVLIP